jgi:hypothetical protein
MRQYVHNNKITFFFGIFILYLHKLSNRNERKARLHDIDAKTRLSNASPMLRAFTFSPFSDCDLYIGSIKREQIVKQRENE